MEIIQSVTAMRDGGDSEDDGRWEMGRWEVGVATMPDIEMRWERGEEKRETRTERDERKEEREERTGKRRCDTQDERGNYKLGYTSNSTRTQTLCNY